MVVVLELLVLLLTVALLLSGTKDEGLTTAADIEDALARGGLIKLLVSSVPPLKLLIPLEKLDDGIELNELFEETELKEFLLPTCLRDLLDIDLLLGEFSEFRFESMLLLRDLLPEKWS